MDRLRVLSLPRGEVSRRDRDRIRQKPERRRDSEGERVKGRAEKARAESENLAKKQGIDQSQDKSKARRRATAIVSLDFRLYLPHE